MKRGEQTSKLRPNLELRAPDAASGLTSSRPWCERCGHQYAPSEIKDRADYPNLLFEIENYARIVNSLFSQFKPHNDRHPLESRSTSRETCGTRPMSSR